MAKIYPKSWFGDKIVDTRAATLPVTSSAVLYGLSVYTVFNVEYSGGELLGFRLPEHFKRLTDSCRIIGIDGFNYSFDDFLSAAKQVIDANQPQESVFIRASVHVNADLPGTKSRGLPTILSLFVYRADPIVPRSGARLKTSVWRRIPDNAIPSRAKVNGAYVNSVLAKQDAIDSGYDDCIFLDTNGHVCELSAANIFLVRNGRLITPDTTSDLLEGINRRSVIELARDLKLTVEERTVDLTELYIADEVFITGTSAYLTPVIEIDGRKLASEGGPVTKLLSDAHKSALSVPNDKDWLTKL